MPRTAAALIIGNEILSGKIADTNTTLLARALFDLGIELRRVVVCPDEIRNDRQGTQRAARRTRPRLHQRGGRSHPRRRQPSTAWPSPSAGPSCDRSQSKR